MKSGILAAGLTIMMVAACGKTDSSTSGTTDIGFDQEGISGYWYFGASQVADYKKGYYVAIGAGKIHVYAKCVSFGGAESISRLEADFDQKLSVVVVEEARKGVTDFADSGCTVILPRGTHSISSDNGRLRAGFIPYLADRVKRDDIYGEGLPNDREISLN